MQGWRKTMEDAHVARTDVALLQLGSSVSSNTSNTSTNDDVEPIAVTPPPPPQPPLQHVFGVFDGHGGAEVARFTALYLISVLQHQLQQQQQQQIPRTSDTHENSNHNNNNSINMGQALVQTFHALDRMIDDVDRREELVRLRAMPPTRAEQRQARSIPPPLPTPTMTCTTTPTSSTMRLVPEQPSVMSASTVSSNTPIAEATAAESPCEIGAARNSIEPPDPEDERDGLNTESSTTEENPVNSNPIPLEENDERDADSLHPEGTEEASALDQDISSSEEEDDDDEGPVEILQVDSPLPDSSQNVVASIQTSAVTATTTTSTLIAIEPSSNVGDTMVEPDSSGSSSTSSSSGLAVGKVTGMLQRLLKLSSGPSGHVVMQVIANKNGTMSPASQRDGTSGGLCNNTPSNPHLHRQQQQQQPASIVRNGQMICNLPDHPIHAGATAIVAVLSGRTLTVANAGDSRAVLCRGLANHPHDGSGNSVTHAVVAVVVPLSLDHKPMQITELTRIHKAGGFVNAFGRINGNLNLSRSIGDLKYKQVRRLTPAQQMITAEPDILELELLDTDEFIILGCDGIWDCLTNEKAVEFVQSRIDNKTLIEIGSEMLDTILSTDPRSTQGIGGDNMTIMIIDLQPARRSHRMRSIAAAATTTTTTSSSALHDSSYDSVTFDMV